MAQAHELDFNSFVQKKKEERAGGGPETTGHEYTYELDRQSRIAFEKSKPVQLAVEAAVRLVKQMKKHELLGQAVKVSDRQFPRIYQLSQRCADALHIAQPQVYIVNDPRINAATLGTNDDSFIMVHSALVDHYSDEDL